SSYVVMTGVAIAQAETVCWQRSPLVIVDRCKCADRREGSLLDEARPAAAGMAIHKGLLPLEDATVVREADAPVLARVAQRMCGKAFSATPAPRAHRRGSAGKPRTPPRHACEGRHRTSAGTPVARLARRARAFVCLRYRTCLLGYLSGLLTCDQTLYLSTIRGLLGAKNTAWLGVSPHPRLNGCAEKPSWQAEHVTRPSTKPPTQIQPGAILQHHFRAALEQRMHFTNAGQVDQRAAVDAQEACGVELGQQVAQGVAVQVADRADVDVQVVAVGADPVDVVDGEYADVFAVAHAEALRVAAGRRWFDRSVMRGVQALPMPVHPRHGLVEAGLLDRLEYVVQRHRVERLQCVFGEGGGEYHQWQTVRRQFVQQFEAVHAGHLDVQEQQVRAQHAHGLHRFRGVAALADDLNFGVRGQCLTQRQARQHFVVDQYGAQAWCVHAACSANGKRTSARVPPPVSGVSSSCAASPNSMRRRERVLPKPMPSAVPAGGRPRPSSSTRSCRWPP